MVGSLVLPLVQVLLDTLVIPPSANCPIAIVRVQAHLVDSSPYVVTCTLTIHPISSNIFFLVPSTSIHSVYSRRRYPIIYSRCYQPIPSSTKKSQRVPHQNDLLHLAQLHKLHPRHRLVCSRKRDRRSHVRSHLFLYVYRILICVLSKNDTRWYTSC